jgi:hypothetical protein
MGFINKYSYKCLLGKFSKNINDLNNIYSWTVHQKRDLATCKQLTEDDLEYISSMIPLNFHYLSESNLLFLKKHFNLRRTRNTSIILDITDLSLQGHKMKNVRYSFNRCSKNTFEICDNFKDIKDVQIMIDEWANNYTDKYFRNFSGKNVHFFKNDFHKDCINIFVYDNKDLISFGSISPVINGTSTYIIGKALYKRYYGLSEWTDIMLYKKAQMYGIEKVNMGRALKTLYFYKNKFPGSVEHIEYDGTIESLKDVKI